jgi:hypothetical protein
MYNFAIWQIQQKALKWFCFQTFKIKKKTKTLFFLFEGKKHNKRKDIWLELVCLTVDYESLLIDFLKITPILILFIAIHCHMINFLLFISIRLLCFFPSNKKNNVLVFFLILKVWKQNHFNAFCCICQIRKKT